MDAKKAEEKLKAEKQAAAKAEREKADGQKTDGQKSAGTPTDASKRILDIIKEGKLSAGQINIIVQAIQNSFTSDELEYLYSLTMDSEQMTREYERIRKGHHRRRGHRIPYGFGDAGGDPSGRSFGRRETMRQCFVVYWW